MEQQAVGKQMAEGRLSRDSPREETWEAEALRSVSVLRDRRRHRKKKARVG